jgi:hypothetical protein
MAESLIDRFRKLEIVGIKEEHIIQAGPCVIIMVGDKAITAYDGDFPQIYMDGVDETDKMIMKRCATLIEESGIFDALAWTVNEIQTNLVAPGFEELDYDSSSDDDNIHCMLPELEYDPERELVITSWGVNQKGEGGHAPSNSQYNVNASLLSSSKKGLNLK